MDAKLHAVFAEKNTSTPYYHSLMMKMLGLNLVDQGIYLAGTGKRELNFDSFGPCVGVLLHRRSNGSQISLPVNQF